jgi:hypothetical protein
MSEESIPEATYASTFGHAIDHLAQAGSRTEQGVLRDLGWTMLETWQLPDGASGSRLANAWLGEHRWRVQIAPHREMWKPEWVAPLAEAAARSGHQHLFGTSVGIGEFRDRAVWRIPTNADDVSRFFEAHYPMCSLLFPADRSFAIHCVIGELAAYAGPEAFVREVLPPEAIGPHATAAAIAYMNPDLTEDDYRHILDGYRPFMFT